MQIHLYGDCPLRDASKQMNQLGIKSSYIPSTQTTSVFSNPEKRVRDIAKEWWYKNLETKFKNDMRVRVNVELVHKELIKNELFDLVNNPNNNGIIVFSNGNELHPRWCKDNEYIMLNDAFLKQLFYCVQNYNFPRTIYELLIDPRYIIPFNDESHLHLLKHEFGPMFCDFVYSKFKNNALLFGSAPATEYFNKKLGFYKELPSFNASSIIYKKSNSPKYAAVESNHSAAKVLKYVFTGARRRWPNKGSKPLNYLWISEKQVVGDDHHNLGRHPLHYDHSSIRVITRQLVKKINEIQNIDLFRHPKKSSSSLIL